MDMAAAVSRAVHWLVQTEERELIAAWQRGARTSGLAAPGSAWFRDPTPENLGVCPYERSRAHLIATITNAKDLDVQMALVAFVSPSTPHTALYLYRHIPPDEPHPIPGPRWRFPWWGAPIGILTERGPALIQ